jgi:hypothetical protein
MCSNTNVQHPDLWRSTCGWRVQVLTTGSWPTQSAAQCSLPVEMERCCTGFQVCCWGGLTIPCAGSLDVLLWRVLAVLQRTAEHVALGH